MPTVKNYQPTNIWDQSFHMDTFSYLFTCYVMLKKILGAIEKTNN